MSPAVRYTSKLNSVPLESQPSSWLVARAEEKQILKLSLALLVLIIISLRVVARVPLVH